MTTRVGRRLGALYAALAWSAVLPVSAEESTSNAPRFEKPNFAYKDMKTKEGLVFRVPADMPIEIREGIQAPVPFDEYIYGKFGHLEARISQMDQRLSRIEEKIDRLAPYGTIVELAQETTKEPAAANPAGILKAGIES